jgi:hypothetical protein
MENYYSDPNWPQGICIDCAQHFPRRIENPKNPRCPICDPVARRGLEQAQTWNPLWPR